MSQENLRPIPSPEETKRLFLERLAGVQETLNQQGIPYRVLGSIANHSYTGLELNFARPNMQGFLKVPDIDILVPRDRLGEVEIIRRELLQGWAPINLELFPGQMFIDWRPDEDQSYLTHKKFERSVSSRLFDPVVRDVEGVPIITVAPETLFHTFALIGGGIRHKDWGRIMPLGRYIRSQGRRRSEAEYYAVHEFIKEREKRYPWDMKVMRFALNTAPKLPPALYRTVYALALDRLPRIASSHYHRRDRHS